MNSLILFDSLLLGIQHSFEADHVAAVSVLAGDKSRGRLTFLPLVWTSTQWALGHSAVMILFSLFILVLKFSLSLTMSEFTEQYIIGPLMIFLGLSAIARVFNLSPGKRRTEEAGHARLFKSINRSFIVGMLHGLAGTGAACSIALTLAADDVYTALAVIAVQCLGILAAMTLYSLVLIKFVTHAGGTRRKFLNYINLIVGIISITIGIFYFKF